MDSAIEIGADEPFEVPVLHRVWRRSSATSGIDTYGGKELLDDNGTPAYAEHMIVSELLRGGAKWAYWSDNFRRRFSSEVSRYLSIDKLPLEAADVFSTLVKVNGGRRGGIWDVFGLLADGTVVIREAKRQGKDALRAGQQLFAERVWTSIPSVDLAIVEWTTE